MEPEQITKRIGDCVSKVYDTIGFGFPEEVYRRSLLLEMRKAGLRVRLHGATPEALGATRARPRRISMAVENGILLQLASAPGIARGQEQQFLDELAATGLRSGLLVNFGESKAEMRKTVTSNAADRPATQA